MNYENEEGVHLKNPLNPEFTMCGDAFDITSDEMYSRIDGYDVALEIQTTHKKTITCARCISIIKACRGVRIKEA